MLPSFNCGDAGVVVQIFPQKFSGRTLIADPIPSDATGLTVIFKGETTHGRVESPVTAQNSGQYAQYTITGTDFTIPDVYSAQLFWFVGGERRSSVAPLPAFEVGALT